MISFLEILDVVNFFFLTAFMLIIVIIVVVLVYLFIRYRGFEFFDEWQMYRSRVIRRDGVEPYLQSDLNLFGLLQ